MAKKRDFEACVSEARTVWAEGARKSESTLWRLGELALEAVPMGRPGKPAATEERLRAFAVGVGELSWRTAETYRALVNFYGQRITVPETGSEVSLAVYRKATAWFSDQPEAARAFIGKLALEKAGTRSGRWTVASAHARAADLADVQGVLPLEEFEEEDAGESLYSDLLEGLRQQHRRDRREQHQENARQRRRIPSPLQRVITHLEQAIRAAEDSKIEWSEQRRKQVMAKFDGLHRDLMADLAEAEAVPTPKRNRSVARR